jgi:hypothetical protein
MSNLQPIPSHSHLHRPIYSRSFFQKKHPDEEDWDDYIYRIDGVEEAGDSDDSEEMEIS